LKEALDSPDKSVIQQKMEILTQSSMALGEAIYKASNEDTSSEIEDESAKTDKEDVIDAEFEEVDDSKKKSD
jgi:molecular chaperone DnaK